jgi:Fic family protein
MSFIEQKRTGAQNYLSFVKKVTFMGRTFVIKKHIGKEIATISKEQYLLNNIDEISDCEFKFKSDFLDKVADQLSFNPSLPSHVEKKTIRLHNLIEMKKCEGLVYSNFAKEFIFNSNNIEGSRIPREKVIEIIDTGDTRYINRNEVKEVANSIRALEYIKSGFKFDLPSIKRLYYILTENLTMENGDPYPRGFKKIQNIVGNSSTTVPDMVEMELLNLLSWYKQNIKKIHPLILAFEFHLRYETIHPFSDGNGRTGRLIMNKILMRDGYFPVIVFQKNKTAYFNAIQKARDGMRKKYYQFLLEQADSTYDLMLKSGIL